MKNIINEQQQANKELLNKIADLEKQLADKDQEREQSIEELKLKIWHLTGQPDENSYVPGHWWYKKLNKKWMDEGKLRMAADPNETREWAKNHKRIWFDNITIEEMLMEFIDSSKELATSCSSYISNWSKRGYQLTEQKREYEKKIADLNKYKEQVEDLEKKLTEILLVWHEEQEEIDNVSWEDQFHNWDLGELKNLTSRTEKELNKVVFEVIEKLEQSSKDLAEAINKAEEWKNWQKGLLNDEIKQKSLMLQKSDKMLEEEITKNAKLHEELAQKLEMLRKNDQRFEDEAKEREELKIQLYLERKPLPALPKEENNTLTKQNTFKQLKTKTRVKVQQLQKLIKRKKFHSQALVTKIEVPVK